MDCGPQSFLSVKMCNKNRRKFPVHYLNWAGVKPGMLDVDIHIWVKKIFYMKWKLNERTSLIHTCVGRKGKNVIPLTQFLSSYLTIHDP